MTKQTPEQRRAWHAAYRDRNRDLSGRWVPTKREFERHRAAEHTDGLPCPEGYPAYQAAEERHTDWMATVSDPVVIAGEKRAAKWPQCENCGEAIRLDEGDHVHWTSGVHVRCLTSERAEGGKGPHTCSPSGDKACLPCRDPGPIRTVSRRRP